MKLKLVLLVTLLLTACAPAPALPDLPPNDIVMKAGQAMLHVPSFHFKIEIGGSPVYLNRATGLQLRSAEGDFARPDRMGVHLKVIAAMVAAELDMIAIGDEQYLTNILTQQWEVLPPEFGFNPAVMFDPQVGLEQVLSGGIDEARLVGVESIDNASVYHVTGRLDGARVQGMSGGLIGTSRVEAEVWVDGSTFVPRKAVVIDLSADPQKPTTWTLTFGSYSKPVKVVAPEVR
jgi:lipoprotein LprG